VTVINGSNQFEITQIDSQAWDNVDHRFGFVLCSHPFVMDKSEVEGTGDGKTYSFSLYRLDSTFEAISRECTRTVRPFFNALAKALSALPVPENDLSPTSYQNALSRLFVLNAIDPLLRDIESGFVETICITGIQQG